MTENTNPGNQYRFYSFTNMYLSSIQKGIQTAHAVSEMSKTVYPTNIANDAYSNWAKFDKTIIVLNGGNQAMLQMLYDFAVPFGKRFDLPVVKFHEDEQSLNGALTAVGIILPSCWYELASNLRTGTASYDGFDIITANFLQALNSCGLAN